MLNPFYSQSSSSQIASLDLVVCDVMIYVSLVSISRLHHNNVTSCLPVSKLHKTVISPGVMLQIYRTLIRHNLQDFSR